jgi:ABC-type polysaccharide/polyol phosphate export permease
VRGSRLFTAPVRLLFILGRHRFLLRQLAWRAFMARHAGSYLGWLWTPVSTAIQLALYIVVFSVILKIKAGELGIDLAKRPDVGFGMFLMTALVPFLALNDAVTRAAGVFRSHVSLVQRVRFPAEVLVIGNISGALLHHLVALVVVVIVCGIKGHLGADTLAWIVLGIGIWGLWIVGLSLTASLLGAILPDFSEVLTLVFQVGLYGAPIIYPLSFVSSESLRLVIQANPLTPLVGVARAGLIGSQPPSFGALLLLLAGGLLLVAVGAAAMERWRDTIPDLL